MIITKKRKVKLISIKIKNIELGQCTSYKFLGVMSDKDLSWKPHVEYISNKISRSLGGLAILRHRTSISVLREVYHALINSYVKYGILTLGNACDSVLQPLKLLLNKVIRVITFAPYGPVDIKLIYRKLEFLDLNETISLEKGKFMFKRKKDLLPTTIANYFDFEPQSAHTYNLRSQRNSSYRFRGNTITGKKSI